MAVPASVIAAGWIPFVIVLVLTFLFSAVYIRYYQSRYNSEVSSTITAILGLTITLLTAMLLPVDIFLVSYMKNSNGTFKEWALSNTSRADVENAVLYGYYSLYAIVVFFAFMIIPFVYFYYEEKDEESSTAEQLCNAVKYTIGFLFVAGTLLIVGAFLPLKPIPRSNVTEWQNLAYLFEQIPSQSANAFSFLLNILMLIGTLAVITYTAYGMAAWPIGLIKGSKSKSKQHGELLDQKLQVQSMIICIRDKYQDGRRMVSRDRDTLHDLEEKERMLERGEREFEGSNICLEKCCHMLRPFQIVFGVIFLLISLIIFCSLLLSNIDKLINSPGYNAGYALINSTLPNPLDIILVFSQKVFPLDYIIIIGIVLYFILCSMTAIKQMGIWFMWIRMYKIRSRRTRPQALLLMCMILIFIILALNTLIYSIVPQYTLFGSQHYWNLSNSSEYEHSVNKSLISCNLHAPNDECVITQLGKILLQYFVKATFFGAAHFWLSWVFLLAFIIGIFVAVIKKRLSALDGLLKESDSEDEFLIS